jgi:spore germination cell wall hydrolase CwlJ-like protein
MRLGQVAGSAKPSSFVPIIVGLGLWIGFPTPTALQDMVSLVSGVEGSGVRWNAFVEKAAAGSVQAADMPFVDATVTGSISGAGVNRPSIGTIAFRSKAAAGNAVPDEERITRGDKKGRVVNVAPVAPPKAFNAGSVLQRSSMLLRSTFDGGLKMAFAKPTIKGKEIQIATAFYEVRDGKRNPGVPAAIADLVTNDRADVLATAYAPATPNYAKSSPFETLLKEEQPNNGRFIPPVVDGDHAWMSTPLPASVFSASEQKCLATAVYFEARGENTRGQAAVAQVVLNRVRNPAYPNTICGVVYQNDNWRNACQFSFACDGHKDRITSAYHYKLAQEIAMAVTAGKIFIADVGSSTHYHATYVHPRWSRTMEKMKKIGLHIFYRTYGGGWS